MEDSESDFEVKVRRLLHSGQTEDPTQGTRRSERRKKPSSRWNEEAGFLPQPPRSSKKKGNSSTTPEGTIPNPLLFNDWNDLQLINYCNACGISFDSLHHRDNCLSHLRMLESTRMTSSNSGVGTSTVGSTSGPT